MHWSVLARRVVLLLSIASVPASQGSVWRVDDDGPADFAALQAAVDAAADGDVVLVASGRYVGFRIDGKGLTIAGQGDVLIDAGLEDEPLDEAVAIIVRATTVQQLVAIRGVDIDTGERVEASVFVEECQGPVWFEDCTLGDEGLEAGPRAVAAVVDSPQVAFDSCDIGGPMDNVEVSAGGILAQGSNVYVHHSEVRGVPGVLASWTGAIHVDGGAVFAAGNSLEGPDGFVVPPGCILSPGGASLELNAATAYSVDNELAFGVGGCLTVDTCGVDFCADDGELVESVDDSPLIEFEGRAPELTGSALTVAGRPLKVSLADADPGAIVVLLATPLPTFSIAPEIASAFLGVGETTLAVVLGVTDDGGALETTLTAPSTGPADAVALLGQALVLSLPSNLRTSSGTVMTVLN